MSEPATIPLAERGKAPEAKVLLAALHQDRSRLDDSGIDQLSPDQWDRLVTLAGHQQVRPLLHQRVFETGRWRTAPESAWQRLDAECRRVAIRNMRMHVELSHILRALAEVDIPTIVLKGAYLGPVVYGNIALREMRDLDVMVKRHQLKVAAERLLDLGYEELDPFPVDWDNVPSHHVTLQKPGAASIVELHWATTPVDQLISMDPDQLWHRSRPVRVGGDITRCLSASDQLLHLCLHASFQHQFEFGLRPACDLGRLLAHHGGELDWNEIVDSCARHRWNRGVGLFLAIAERLVGASVPVDAQARFACAGAPVDVAEGLSWITPAETRSAHPSLAALGGETSWRTRLRAIRGRFFLPKAELLASYRVNPGTSWWWLLYGRRAHDLLRNHFAASLRMMTGVDEHANALADRRNAVRRWLAQL